MMKKATQEEAVAVIRVFWDIKMCPVPPGFDARRVGPCIKRLLQKHGYHGPLTIKAVGTLTDVPIDVLRGVYSSGIPLIIVPYGTKSIPSLINGITPPAPANFMIISEPSFCTNFAPVLHYFGYNPLQFPYDGIQSLIMADSGALEEDTHESPLWDCLVCARDPPGQGFENFTTHLSSQEHQELLLAQLKRNVVLYDPSPPISSLMLLRNGWMDMTFLPPPTFESPRDITGYHWIDSEAVMSEGETFVFWDINKCPVPPGCDARLVGPCIKLFLKKKGCTGPLTIVAIGVLAEVPQDILSEVYSSGISLHNVPYDSGAIEEDKSSETGKSAFWICSVCYPNNSFHGFEWFTSHISSRKHLQKLSDLLPMSTELRCMNSPISEPHEIDLGAVTLVVWDIKMCPIPPGCDPRWVGPCIKQFLENKGYSGPLTITAIGALTNFPDDILRGVCSSGIALHNVAYGFSAAEYLFDKFANRNPPPANIMVISNVKISPYCVRLQTMGYNFLRYDSLQSFNLTDSGAPKEDKCSETGESASWVCATCYPFLSGQGFANFTSHIASIPHQRRLLDWFPRKGLES